MSTNGLDPPTSLLSTLWDNCWINGGQPWGLTLQLVCNKGVFSAHICFVQSWNDHSPSGGHKAMVLATISKTEGFRYWICVLLMMSLYVQNRNEEIGHVLDMLVDAFRKVGFVLNAGEINKKKNGAEPTSSRTSSRTCIVWRNRCADFGTRPWAKWSGCMIVFE